MEDHKRSWMEGHGRSHKIMKGHGNSYKGQQSVNKGSTRVNKGKQRSQFQLVNIRSWNVMEGHGRSWNVMDGQ